MTDQQMKRRERAMEKALRKHLSFESIRFRWSALGETTIAAVTIRPGHEIEVHRGMNGRSYRCLYFVTHPRSRDLPPTYCIAQTSTFSRIDKMLEALKSALGADVGFYSHRVRMAEQAVNILTEETENINQNQKEK